MATGPITRVSDVRTPKVGARVRFRTSAGDVVEGVVGDNGRQFDYAKGDRLLRYHKPSRAPRGTTATAAPATYGYLNIGIHVLSFGSVLFLAAKLWGVL